jgi:hypothetical protein
VGCDPPSEAFVATLFTGADNVVCTAHPAALARSKRRWSSKRTRNCRSPPQVGTARCQPATRLQEARRIRAALAERTRSFRRPPGWRRSEYGGVQGEVRQPGPPMCEERIQASKANALANKQQKLTRRGFVAGAEAPRVAVDGVAIDGGAAEAPRSLAADPLARHSASLCGE